MPFFKKVLLILGVLLFAGCASKNASVDFRTDYDFSKLHTFDILPVDKSVFDNPKISEIDVKRIGGLLSAELSKRYKAVAEPEADFLVRYFIVVEERMRVDTYNASFGMYRGGYGYHYGIQSPEVRNTYYQQGSIIVDILDKQSNEVVWRGSTEGRLKKDVTPAERDEQVARYLAELFEEFPPGQ